MFDYLKDIFHHGHLGKIKILTGSRNVEKVHMTFLGLYKYAVGSLPPKYAITVDRMRVTAVRAKATTFQLQWNRHFFPRRNFSL